MPSDQELSDFLGRLTGRGNRADAVLSKLAGDDMTGQQRADDFVRRLAGGTGPDQGNVEQERRRTLTDAEARKTPRPPKPQYDV
jgi:hypothetical protein